MWRCYKEGTEPPYGPSIRYGGVWPYWWIAFIYVRPLNPVREYRIKTYYFRLRWYYRPRWIWRVRTSNLMLSCLFERNIIPISRETFEDLPVECANRITPLTANDLQLFD